MTIVTGRLFALLVLAGIAALPAHGAEEDEPFQWEFLTGRFQLIGRYPDSQRTYTGTARIERVDKQLRLTRNVAGKKSVIHGVVRRADPGEAYVLAFKWQQRATMEMVCLIGSDLDNYPRLTCHWGKTGNPHGQPGMEAYFAQEPWDPIKP